MSIVLGCIADDYTGASDLASMLSHNGLRTVQTIGVPREALALPLVDAVVISLKSRSIAAAEAVALSLEADRWLRARGAGHVMFKVCSTFDSTDAGNIGPVTDALRAQAGGGIVLVNPSFPENRRTVYQGHLFIGDMLLHESPMKDHPLNPMRDSNLVRVLARQSAAPVSLVPLGVVEAGAGAVRVALAEAASRGAGAAIADSVAARHLDAIGEAALDSPVSTGASGLGSSLARALVARGDAKFASRADDGMAAIPGGKSAILAGSCSAATLRQIAAAEKKMPYLRLDVEKLLAGPREIKTALAWALSHLDSGPVLIASSGTAATVQALQSRYGASVVGHAIEQSLADLAEALVQAGVSRLVVAGGETSGAVVDRLGIEAFVVGKSIAPGVPVLLGIGKNRAGISLALKSGNFGGEEFFSEALAAFDELA